jgi:hypothetical protein
VARCQTFFLSILFGLSGLCAGTISPKMAAMVSAVGTGSSLTMSAWRLRFLATANLWLTCARNCSNRRRCRIRVASAASVTLRRLLEDLKKAGIRRYEDIRKINY